MAAPQDAPPGQPVLAATRAAPALAAASQLAAAVHGICPASSTTISSRHVHLLPMVPQAFLLQRRQMRLVLSGQLWLQASNSPQQTQHNRMSVGCLQIMMMHCLVHVVQAAGGSWVGRRPAHPSAAATATFLPYSSACCYQPVHPAWPVPAAAAAAAVCLQQAAIQQQERLHSQQQAHASQLQAAWVC